MSYYVPSENEIADYFKNCRHEDAPPQKQPPSGFSMDAAMKTIAAMSTIELPSDTELFHANKSRHWGWFRDKDEWHRRYLNKQKPCAQGFWFSMDPVASLGEGYRNGETPLAKFRVERPLRLLDLTENVVERRVAWEKLVDAIERDPYAVDPNAPWADLVRYNESTYGKRRAEETFGRLFWGDGRAYPDYYHWFWMALDLSELDGYVSYDPVDARAHSYAGDVSKAMGRELFPPIVHSAESANEVFNVAKGKFTPFERVAYAFPEFGLGWRGVEKIKFECDELVKDCIR